MKKTISLFIILLLIINISIANALEDKYCETQKLFDLYECRVKKICEFYIKDEDLIYKTKKYKKAEGDSWIQDGKDNYTENMNNIYKCALLQTQKNSLNLVKEKLIKIEKTGELKKIALEKIAGKIKKIDLTFKQLKCKGIDKDSIHNKVAVLKQTTYETCKYRNYLEYLQEYNSNIGNALNIKEGADESKTYSIQYIVDLIGKNKNVISEELSHIYKVYPLAYQAYSEYENNYTIHVFLELIRDDFIVFRSKLYKTLGPISQLVYKISNAMSIHE